MNQFPSDILVFAEFRYLNLHRNQTFMQPAVYLDFASCNMKREAMAFKGR